MATTGYIKWADYDNETALTSINMPTLTAANFDAQIAAFQAIRAALVTLTIGRVRTEQMGWKNRVSATAVTDQNAQRETKWLVAYVDQTEYLDAGDTIPNPGYQKTFVLEIPTANLTYLDSSATGYADMDNADVQAFVTAFEAAAGSPYNVDSPNRSISVQSIRHVGRNT